MARVRIYGLDFASAPSPRKPLISVGYPLEGRTLRVEDAEVLPGFEEFERFLEAEGLWAYTKKYEGWGVPEECDREEGCILDPHLLVEDG